MEQGTVDDTEYSCWDTGSIINKFEISSPGILNMLDDVQPLHSVYFCSAHSSVRKNAMCSLFFRRNATGGENGKKRKPRSHRSEIRPTKDRFPPSVCSVSYLLSLFRIVIVL
jgi:hypothetical protein